MNVITILCFQKNKAKLNIYFHSSNNSFCIKRLHHKNDDATDEGKLCLVCKFIKYENITGISVKFWNIKESNIHLK